MRNSLLSIGEASKLKNVSIKALRYYEKIGIFKPAYIDPQSGYRYYSPAQLFDLDVILTCAELDIPLKHLLDYQTDQGDIDLYQLLKEGAKIAEQKIQRAKQSLIQINSYLEEIEEQANYRVAQKFYTRTLNFTYLYTKPWDTTRPFEIKKYLKTMRNLYLQVECLGFTPLYFQGFIIDSQTQSSNEASESRLACNTKPQPDTKSQPNCSTKPPHTSDAKTQLACYTYVAIDFYPNTIPAITDNTHFDTIDNASDLYFLPETTYRGFRIESNDLTGCINEAVFYAKTHPGFYVMTEIWDAQLAASTYVIELLQSGKMQNVSVP